MTQRNTTSSVRIERQIRLVSELRECDGPGVKHLAYAGLLWLEANHQHVNALNVFPVPDGDTGTNMLLTMQAAYREVADSSERSASKVAQAVAHGALMGARGNSGVILSQIWRGFARGLGQAEAFDSALLVRAVREACETAYRGVVKPVEGTILTVIRDVATAAEQAAAQSAQTQDLRQMLAVLVDSAFASVERTPELLPVLKQAGVVDSGGKGLAIILEGMLRYVRGLPLDAAQAPAAVPLDLSKVGAALDAVEPGQEWEVVLDFRPRGVLHLPTLYSRLEAMGTSIQVGEGDGLYRVHVHLLKKRRHEPIELAEELGTVVKVHMENLLDQLESLPGQAPEAGDLPLTPVQPGQVAVVAVAPGPGLARILAAQGAAAIVSGGQSMNPSTQDILAAIESVPTDQVIVLPNNKNIILAAQQAAALTAKQVRVIAARTVPQGLAALLTLLPGDNLEAAAKKMEPALSSVETGELTTATRTVEIDGVAVVEGQVIGLHNGVLKVAGSNLPEVLMQLLEALQIAERSVTTLFYGADITAAEAEHMAERIRAAYPHLEVVDVHAGGQPHYHYILSVE